MLWYKRTVKAYRTLSQQWSANGYKNFGYLANIALIRPLIRTLETELLCEHIIAMKK